MCISRLIQENGIPFSMNLNDLSENRAISAMKAASRIAEENGIPVAAKELDTVLPDPKDRVFYEVVFEKRKTKDAYLVTGNLKHFPLLFFQ